MFRHPGRCRWLSSVTGKCRSYSAGLKESGWRSRCRCACSMSFADRDFRSGSICGGRSLPGSLRRRHGRTGCCSLTAIPLRSVGCYFPVRLPPGDRVVMTGYRWIDIFGLNQTKTVTGKGQCLWWRDGWFPVSGAEGNSVAVPFVRRKVSDRR